MSTIRERMEDLLESLNEGADGKMMARLKVIGAKVGDQLNKIIPKDDATNFIGSKLIALMAKEFIRDHQAMEIVARRRTSYPQWEHNQIVLSNEEWLSFRHLPRDRFQQLRSKGPRTYIDTGPVDWAPAEFQRLVLPAVVKLQKKLKIDVKTTYSPYEKYYK